MEIVNPKFNNQFHLTKVDLISRDLLINSLDELVLSFLTDIELLGEVADDDLRIVILKDLEKLNILSIVKFYLQNTDWLILLEILLVLKIEILAHFRIWRGSVVGVGLNRVSTSLCSLFLGGLGVGRRELLVNPGVSWGTLGAGVWLANLSAACGFGLGHALGSK